MTRKQEISRLKVVLQYLLFAKSKLPSDSSGPGNVIDSFGLGNVIHNVQTDLAALASEEAMERHREAMERIEQTQFGAPFPKLGTGRFRPERTKAEAPRYPGMLPKHGTGKFNPKRRKK